MKRVFMLFIGFTTLIAMIGCSSSRKTANIPEPGPLAEKYVLASDSTSLPNVNGMVLSGRDTLSLTDAVQMALLYNPELQSYSYEIRAREAHSLQESFAPNPEIEIEVENFGGSGELQDFKGSELTISVGQLIELAGKRDKRTQVAVLKSDLSAWDYESKKLDILTKTVKQYYQLIAAQEQIALNQELVKVSEGLHQAINRLVKAGRTSPAEISRTQILLSTAQQDLNRSLRNFEADRFRLSSFWGDRMPGFQYVTGSLQNVSEIPSADSLKKFLLENPDIVRWATEIEVNRTVESLEKARQIPDPMIQAGYRHITEPNLNAIVANLSIPIPVFDNNKGAVQEAYNRRKKAEEEHRQIEVEISTNLIVLHQNLLVLFSEIDNSNNIIIPEAQKAYQIINDGYLLGKFSFLDVLQSQKTLFEARKNLIKSLMSYHMHIAEMEKLIGRPLSTIGH